MRGFPTSGFLLIAIAGLAMAAPAAADDALPKSVMFTGGETVAVRQALADAQSGKLPAEEGGGLAGAASDRNIYVSGVADMGDAGWTVWANGLRISPTHQAEAFTVEAVKDDVVDIAVGGEHPAKFRLHPYQTWRAAHHDIVEGIVP